MNTPNKDLPAFATSSLSCADHASYLQEGLTKREYFAGLAMQGLLSNSELTPEFARNTNIPAPSFVSRVSLQIADALLEALEAKQTLKQ